MIQQQCWAQKNVLPDVVMIAVESCKRLCSWHATSHQLAAQRDESDHRHPSGAGLRGARIRHCADRRRSHRTGECDHRIGAENPHLPADHSHIGNFLAHHQRPHADAGQRLRSRIQGARIFTRVPRRHRTQSGQYGAALDRRHAGFSGTAHEDLLRSFRHSVFQKPRPLWHNCPAFPKDILTMSRFFAAALVFFLLTLSLVAQRDNERPAADRDAASPDQQKDQKDKAAAKPEPPPAEKPPVVMHHEVHVGGKILRYTTTTGLMPLTDEEGKVDAHIFFIAYTLDNPGPGKRPLTFSFNGGPGSASVWLHLSAIGPKRVKMQAEGMMPAPPYTLVDNDATWLDQTDLVFIDPVGTGYSRAITKEKGKKFWGLRGDIESVGDFIRLYLGRYERWSSPLFMVGESYGTTRAAGLSGYLVEHGIAFNGVILISSALNFETLEFTPGNDLPYILFLPTYASTAWYHTKVSPEL